MARRATRDMSLEQYEDWMEGEREMTEIKEIAGEVGGPRLMKIPEVVDMPLYLAPDLVPNPEESAEKYTAGPPEIPSDIVFNPEPSYRLQGWSAFRQRVFIESLAETGSVHVAAKAANLSARGAYALRIRSAPFAAAWDAAQQIAVGRLSVLAFDRAIHGRIEQIYHDGELIGEKRLPSERLLMWLLARLDPKRFAAPWERRKDDNADPQADARTAFPQLLESLSDAVGDSFNTGFR